MIRAFLFATMLFWSVDSMACPMADLAEYEAKAKEVQQANGSKASFVLVGMTCGSCSGKVYEALNKVEGVIKTAVDYQSGKVEVAFNSKKTSKAKLQSALTATGYKLKTKS